MIHLKMAISSSITVKSRVIGISIPRTGYETSPKSTCIYDNASLQWKFHLMAMTEGSHIMMHHRIPRKYIINKTAVWSWKQVICLHWHEFVIIDSVWTNSIYSLSLWNKSVNEISKPFFCVKYFIPSINMCISCHHQLQLASWNFGLVQIHGSVVTVFHRAILKDIALWNSMFLIAW